MEGVHQRIRRSAAVLDSTITAHLTLCCGGTMRRHYHAASLPPWSVCAALPCAPPSLAVHLCILHGRLCAAHCDIAMLAFGVQSICWPWTAAPTALRASGWCAVLQTTLSLHCAARLQDHFLKVGYSLRVCQLSLFTIYLGQLHMRLR